MRGIAKAMATTIGVFARGPVTREYPERHRPIPERDRRVVFGLSFLIHGRHRLPFIESGHDGVARRRI